MPMDALSFIIVTLLHLSLASSAPLPPTCSLPRDAATGSLGVWEWVPSSPPERDCLLRPSVRSSAAALPLFHLK